MPPIAFLGDSLTAGLGLGEEAAYPALVGEILAQRGVRVRIVNAGVSGDTTAGGVARVDWLLPGMEMPPNYGPDYTRDFEALYGRLAREPDLDFLPFLLEGVAAIPELNQPDGIHPTAEGQRKIADLVVQSLLPLLRPEKLVTVN